MDELAPKLSEILKRASLLVGTIESTSDGASVFTVEDILRSASAMDEDREKKIKINMALNDLKEYYRGLPMSKRDADAQIIVTDTQAYAYLTLVPPRSGGRMLAFPDIINAINTKGISYGLNYAVLEAASDKFIKKEGLIYSLKIAECAFPTCGDDAAISFNVKCLDKMKLFDSSAPVAENIASLVEHVEMGRVVARIAPAEEGTEGTNVRGERIPPMKGKDIPFAIGAEMRVLPNGHDLVSLQNGALVRGETSLNIVPFYTVAGDLESAGDIRFSGNVLVTGNVHGPLSIQCEDLFVQGNVEAATIFVGGDVYIGGGIIGKKTGAIEADGRIFARHASDATLRAFGDIVIKNSITYSDVSANGCVSVTSERGSIVGGSVSALKGIVANSIGSDFGTYTATTVGKDFLTTSRLVAIERRIKEHETSLAKMDMLKKKLAEAKVDISKLPPDKQDIYISILQKEIKTREEMNSLRRGKDKFDRAIKEFLTASIRVANELHPPVRVQIGEAIREIRERMEKVILVLDRDNTIHTKQEEGN